MERTAAWAGALAGSMPTKSHTLPRVGRCRATSFDVGSKRHRTGRRAPQRRSVSFLLLQFQRSLCRQGACPVGPQRTRNYCRRPRLTDPEEPPLLGYRTMRRPNRTAAYQVGPSSHRSPHGDFRRRPPPPRGSSRHAPMVREATTCFMCRLLLKTMLRNGKSALRDSFEFQHIY